MEKKEYSLEIGGKTLTATFSDLVDQASGSVIIRYDGTAILVTAVMDKKAGDAHFFPLTVDYEERFYASGKILGSRFQRREGRPSDEAILTGRVVDRTIRPLFDQWIRNGIQVVVTVLALGDTDPDTLAVIGASLALSTSHIPWNGPVSSVRVGKKAGSDEFTLNPTYAYRDEEDTELDVTVCGKDDMINMVEVGSNEVSEDAVASAFEFGNTAINQIQKWQQEIITEIGKEKSEIPKPVTSEVTIKLFEELVTPRLKAAVMSGTPGKKSIVELMYEWIEIFKERLPEEDEGLAAELYEERVNDMLHIEAIENERRADGRSLDEIRPLYAQAGEMSDILHGSGTFYRGGTHILSVLTLGSPSDSQVLDGMEIQEKKRFMHHYNFPPFSVGETGRIGGVNRRMVGHGALAEKALLPVIPKAEEFPYTIRIVSEALASNGSTSMGSVCGSTLALMDAGVPITRPVAGIASGLMTDGTNYKVLTDIQGPEDHHGDMDFKVAGTTEGITAIQMDVKVGGVPIPVLAEALEKARLARLQILDVITKAIPAPRENISPNAPKIVTVKIKQDQIGMIIGSGGKTINEIREATGTEIDIEDDGNVFITGKGDGPEEAKRIIEEMTHEYKVGEVFSGIVTKITDFGAFVKVGANAEGLVHISEIAPMRIEKVTDVLKEGDQVPVKVIEIDERNRIKLSIKAQDPEFAKKRLETK